MHEVGKSWALVGWTHQLSRGRWCFPWAVSVVVQRTCSVRRHIWVSCSSGSGWGTILWSPPERGLVPSSALAADHVKPSAPRDG